MRLLGQFACFKNQGALTEREFQTGDLHGCVFLFSKIPAI